MTVSIAKLANQVPNCCHAKKCSRDKCSVGLDGWGSGRLIVDMDCKALGLTNMTRCDYLLVGKCRKVTWVVPIEMKGGMVGSVTHVTKQLTAGTKLAENLLPPESGFRFALVLAHKKSMHRDQINRLRKAKIGFHGKKQGIRTIKCGDQLEKVL